MSWTWYDRVPEMSGSTYTPLSLFYIYIYVCVCAYNSNIEKKTIHVILTCKIKWGSNLDKIRLSVWVFCAIVSNELFDTIHLTPFEHFNNFEHISTHLMLRLCLNILIHESIKFSSIGGADGIDLTYWGRDKMVTIFQTKFLNAFSRMKMHQSRLRFHWSLFPKVGLTIFQHWFRNWSGAGQATSHYLDQWWLVYWRLYASIRLNELKVSSGLFNQWLVAWHLPNQFWLIINGVLWHSPESNFTISVVCVRRLCF